MKTNLVRQSWGFALFLGAALILAMQRQALAVDCNTNGIEDATDIAGGTSLDCNSNGIPDECDIFQPTGPGTMFAVSPDIGTNKLYSVDRSTGAISTIGNMNQGSLTATTTLRGWGLELHPTTEQLFALVTSSSSSSINNNLRLMTVNKTTGAATLVGTVGSRNSSATHLLDLAFRDLDGVLFGVSGRATKGNATSSGRICTISTSNGTATLTTINAATGAGHAIAITPGTNTMWHTASAIGIETINLLSNTRSTVGSFPNPGNQKPSLEFTPTSLLFGGRATLCIVDQSTGGTTALGSHGLNVSGYAVANDILLPSSSPDCNSNGVPDECDILDGTSSDVDSNLVPDECEAVFAWFELASSTGPGGAGTVNETFGIGQPLVITRTSTPGNYTFTVRLRFQEPDSLFDMKGISLDLFTNDGNVGLEDLLPGDPDRSVVMLNNEFDSQNAEITPPDPGFILQNGGGVDLFANPESSDLLTVIEIKITLTAPPGRTVTITAGEGLQAWGQEGLASFPLVYANATAIVADAVNGNELSDRPAIIINMDCNSNGIADDDDIAGGTAQDCNSNGVIDECDILHGTSPDCNSNGVPDECDLAGGTSADCNLNDLPDECELETNDCNSNGVPDECDIDEGTSEDCNTNELPDECELLTGDCNSNGVPDACDIFEGTSEDCNDTDVPDECELTGNDCNVNSVPDECDIAGVTSDDCNLNLIPDECDIAGGTSLDCNTNGAPDECEVQAGTSPDCNSNGVPDACDVDGATSPDCNNNGVPDECDLTGVTSADCNSNGLPDECDIAGATSVDCNNNGIPDDCDLLGGTSPDCNNNGVPDSCDIAGVTSSDCNNNQIPDECDIAGLTSPDCNTDDIPDECQLAGNDCNANQVPDECDVDGLTSPDCNTDGVPDECQLGANDCNNNGVPDGCDIADGTSVDCNSNGSPDECDLPGNDCNSNGIPDSCDIAGVTSVDCNSNSTPDECDVAEGTSPDCNTNGVPDACDVAGATSEDCNINNIPDECDVAAGTSPDCNTNGVPDACDVAGATSEDCNNNNIPDDCDISGGTPDCNSNGVPDTCDIAGSTSEDCNNNNIPDDCDIAGGVPDCNTNGVPDACDLAGATSDDCNNNDIPDECDVAELDCNNNGSPDSCDIAGGTSEDCGPNGVPDECDPDCNSNGQADDCDILTAPFNPPLTGIAEGLFGVSRATSNLYIIQHTNNSKTVIAPIGSGGVVKRGFGLAVQPVSHELFAVVATSATVTAQRSLVRVNRVTGASDFIGNLPNGRPADITFHDNGQLFGVRDLRGNGASGPVGSIFTINLTNAATTNVGMNAGTSFGQSLAYKHGTQLLYHTASTQLETCNLLNNQVVVLSNLNLTTKVVGALTFNPSNDLLLGHLVRRSVNSFPNDRFGKITEATGSVQGFTPDTAPSISGIAWVLGSDDCNSNQIPDECEPDCNNNGIADSCDIAQGTSPDCNTNGIPDGCELATNDCNNNDIPDECDLDSGFSEDCNTNGEPDECEPDCNNNNSPDDCDVDFGTSEDCNTNGFPDECDNDCNNNGTADECDIAGGTSLDCNNNDVPDECDIAGTTSEDCNNNQVPDECDIAGDTSEDCNSNDVPDECDIAGDTSEDCNNNAVPDECDLAEGTSADCNSNDVPDECDIAGVTSDDCNSNTVPDECDIAEGTSPDCNNSAVPDECELAGNDCNSNAIPDECDIAGVTSEDCNNNTVPDECDIAGDTSEDCNNNTVPDECDIAQGTSPDCNTSGVPDECELAGNDCNLNTIPDDCDIAGPTSEDCNNSTVPDECELAGNDCNSNTIPDECDIAGVTSEDCNTNTVPDECDIAEGTSLDCNNTAVPDECELSGNDCNVNTVPDECDIAGDTSEDCNSNTIPDECDIAGVTSEDCNGNTVPDECDIAGSSSPDCNNNGVPDSCDIAGPTSEDCNNDAIPDDCQTDCNSNSVPDDCDLTPPASLPGNLFGVSIDSLTTRLYRINRANGSISTVGQMNVGGTFAAPHRSYGLELHPSTQQLYALVTTSTTNTLGTTNLLMMALNKTSGSATLIGTVGSRNLSSAHLVDLAFRGDGILFGVTGRASQDATTSGRIVQVHITTAALTASSLNGGTGRGQAIAIKPGTNLMFHAASSGGLETINMLNNTRTPVGAYPFSVSTGTPPIAAPRAGGVLEFASDGATLFGGRNSLMRINQTTGATTALGAHGLNMGGYALENETPQAATSEDCNTDGIPDECQTDCNSNGQPDDCDFVTPATIAGLFFAAGHSTGTNTSNTSLLYQVNPADGSASTVGNLNVGGSFAALVKSYGLEIHPSTGEMFALVSTSSSIAPIGQNLHLVTVNKVNGAATLVGTVGSRNTSTAHMLDLAFRDNGSLLGVTGGQGRISGGAASTGRIGTINTTTAAVTMLGLNCATGRGHAIAVKPGTDMMWHCTVNTLGQIETVNLLNGARNSLGAFSTTSGNKKNSLEFKPDGSVLFAGRDTLVIVNQSTGATTVVGGHLGGPVNMGGYAIDSDTTFSATSLDCNLNDVPDECDLAGTTSEDCNSNGVPDECDIASGTSLDCNSNGVPDECDIALGTSLDCNSNDVPDECDIAGDTSEDCNSNGVPDECDVAQGTSPDCNNDIVPDECQLVDNDCNANSVPDECDIAGITSDDCNNNDVPDECDLFEGTSDDCNLNDVPDECDIAGVTSTDCNNSGVPDDCELAGNDCNTNDVPDECDLSGGTSLDCNSNALPDECDIASSASPDCNANGVPDECDLSQATSEDCNTNNVPDDCEIGTWIGADGASFSVGSNWDIGFVPGVTALLSNTTATDNRSVLDNGATTSLCTVQVEAPGTGRQILEIVELSTLSASTAANIGTDGELELTGGRLSATQVNNATATSSISGWGRVTGAIVNNGTITGEFFELLDLRGASLNNAASGQMFAPVAANIRVRSTSVTQAGLIQVSSNATVKFDQALVNSSGGEIALLDGTLDALSLTNSASLNGFGVIDTNVTNDTSGDVLVTADMEVVGSMANDGLITVQNGTLTMTGGLSGGGTIIGDFSGRAAGGGLTVLGDYSLDAGATLSMSAEAVLAVGGHCDIAINLNTRYDMIEAELRMIGMGETDQNLEVMSKDVGSSFTGLDPSFAGHYPIGTLRVGPTPTTVNLVDVRDNDNLGQASCEVIYAANVVLEPGTTVNCGCSTIFFETLQDNGGTVNPPSCLVQIGGAICDIDNNGVVDGNDLNAFVQVLMLTPIDVDHIPRCDMNGDGTADGDDAQDFVECLIEFGI